LVFSGKLYEERYTTYSTLNPWHLHSTREKYVCQVAEGKNESIPLKERSQSKL
jgi:hypothetical protein